MHTDDIIDQNLCSLPWLHTEVSLQSNNVRPCCKYKFPVKGVENFVKIWNGLEFSQIRETIKQGVLPAGCSACDVPADTFSYKSFKNDVYRKKFNTPLDPIVLPKVLHITLKNTCNLSCRMCHPGASSKLHETSKKSKYLIKLYNYTPNNNRINIESLRSSVLNIEHITITGGEPLIDEDCYTLINLVKEISPNLKSISFSTNMTRVNQSLLLLLHSLPRSIKIKFNISIDGPEHIHNYIRHGFKWNKLVENIKQLKSVASSFGVNSTVSAMNVGYLSELISTLRTVENQAGIEFRHIMSTPVLESHLHANCVPNNARNAYLEKLKAHTDFGIQGSDILVNTAIHILNQPVGNTSSMFEFLFEFDKVTGTNYATIYPEFVK